MPTNDAAYMRAYRIKNRDRIKKQARGYKSAHRIELAAWQRRYRKLHPNKKHPSRIFARSALNLAVKTGKIIRPSHCSKCHKICKPEAHHPDYSKPLDVIWLCKDCHVIA